MFTGLVEDMGRIVAVQPGSGSTRLGISAPFGPERMETGASIAIDGVCLTVSARDGERYEFDVIEETLRCTTLGRLAPGDQVNLERSLRIGDALGGHLVQGHVDGVASVVDRTVHGDDHRVRVALTPEIRPYVAFKGSVALSGVSLTVSALDADSFEVALIPETLKRTILGAVEVGSALNVEVDLVARYLERLVAAGRVTDGVAGTPS